MYDITDRRSFDDVQNWMDDMSAVCILLCLGGGGGGGGECV